MSNDMPRVTINMSEDDDKRLTKLANREKRSKSKQLIYMMEFYFDQHPELKKL